MDSIPLDIIHYKLFPLLDHSSRIEMNRLLPPCERKPTRLKKEVIDEFTALYSRAMIQRLINTMASSTQKEFLKACREFNDIHLRSLRHFSSFQRKFLRHLTAVSGRLNQRVLNPPALLEDATPRWEFVSKYMKKHIMKYIDTFFIATAAASNSTIPKIIFRKEFTVTLPHHIVVKLPVIHENNYSYTMFEYLEKQMEAQLTGGRSAFWAAREHFT